MGVSEQTFYRWKKKFGNLDLPELRRLKQLEEENRKLKRLVADLSLDNAMIESFNSRFRQECLNEHWFWDLDDATGIIAGWRKYYNTERPHSALGNVTPVEYCRTLAVPGNFVGFPAQQAPSDQGLTRDFSHA